MTMRDIERAVWRATANVVENPKLRMKDVLEFVSAPGDVDLIEDEVAVEVDTLGTKWKVAIPKSCDNRK